MAARPEELRREIAETRDDLGTTLDAIGDRVSPGRIVDRRRAAVRERFTDLRYTVMGRADQVTSAVGGAASSATDAVRSAPGATVQGTQGNPLLAGLVAFGAGVLVATVLPESETEQRAVSAVQDRIEPVKQQLTEAAKEVGSSVAESAQQAAGDLKEQASEAAGEVKETARQGASDVSSHASEAASQVTDEARSTAQQHRQP